MAFRMLHRSDNDMSTHRIANWS